MDISTNVLLTMVLRNICLLGSNLPNTEIPVTLVQPSSGLLNQVRKEVVAGKNGRKQERDGQRFSEKRSH